MTGTRNDAEHWTPRLAAYLVDNQWMGYFFQLFLLKTIQGKSARTFENMLAVDSISKTWKGYEPQRIHPKEKWLDLPLAYLFSIASMNSKS